MGKRDFYFKKHLAVQVFTAAGFLVFFLCLVAVPNAHAWWDGKWHDRRKIQFDTSPSGAGIKEDVSDVPVLVRLHTGNFSFSNAKSDGSDLRFIGADDKSPLKYHVEKFDTKEEIALVWVSVPRLSGNSNQNFIWMYYGNPSATDGQDKGGTYDVNQSAVFHFNEPDGLPKDATSYGNNATLFTGKLGLPSVTGNGAEFTGAGSMMKIAKSSSLDGSKGFTFSAWVRLSQPENDALIFSWGDGSQSIIAGLDGLQAYGGMRSGGGNAVTPKTAALMPKQWHYLAMTIDPGKMMTLYLDGNMAASGRLSGSAASPSGDIVIGASAKGGNNFIGDLDEVQLSNVARPAPWIKASFQSQKPDGTMVSVAEEESGGGNESLTITLLKVIVRTITLDGWLIIGFLFLLGCATLFILVQKITLLNQAGKANRIFSEDFRKIDDPLALYEKEEDYPGSSLYRVYNAGCEELKLWQEKQGKKGGDSRGGEYLTEGAMDSFRAEIEKQAMYESRKLSAGMIVMNISVAGAPFMGLLGTVWGVMNTFASLAASGEANLTAIAPGVASALACTMAGLLVAIPSLFAASYITGWIKDLSADANVFLDEFILKLEEHRREAA
ncbi:MAG: DUF2341 domain-containing protein [Nitrospiraceae bacterium]|nr:DUF2341 domain-containing protein [Nitrospiraceae bacterium]